MFNGGVRHRSPDASGEKEDEAVCGLLFINEHQVSDIGHLSFFNYSNQFKNNGLGVGIAVVKLTMSSLFTIILIFEKTYKYNYDQELF